MEKLTPVAPFTNKLQYNKRNTCMTTQWPLFLTSLKMQIFLNENGFMQEK